MTTSFINRLPVFDTDGRAVVSDTAPAGGDPYLAGIRFLSADNTLYLLSGAVPVDASFQDGFARDTSTGRLCALIDTPPSLLLRRYNDGILGDDAGHMCFTAINAIASYQHGWPVDSIGQVCITAVVPPPQVTFNIVTLSWHNNGELAFNPYFTNFLFGSAGSATAYYTSKAAFTAAHTGLTSQPFTGIAPANGRAAAGSFSGFALSIITGVADVYDAGWFSTHVPNSPAAFPSLSGSVDSVNTLTITFSPAINSFGFQVGKGQLTSDVTFVVKNGATTLATNTIAFGTIDSVTVFDTFAGYSSAGG